jgi:hypothetical protein
MRMKLVLATVVAFLVTACGGAADGAAAPDADDLAAQLDCTEDSDPHPDDVSCETVDGFMGITVFDDNDARDDYITTAESYGVTLLVGDRFVVDASNPDALDSAQEIIGGDVRR